MNKKKEIIMKGDGKLYPCINKKEVPQKRKYFQYYNSILARIDKKVNKNE